MSDNLPLSEQYRLAGKRWADYDAAASLLEDTKSAQLSQWILDEKEKDPDLAHNAAEALVKAGPKWRKLNEDCIRQRRRANKLKVYLESIKMRHMEHQSFEASKRAEMRL